MGAASATTPTEDVPIAPRRWIAGLLIIGAGALAIRLLHLFSMRATPFFAVLLGDSVVYDTWARNIASGHAAGAGVFYQTPLYPYFLGIIYSVAGHHVFLVRVVQAGLGAASCVLLAMAGRRWFGPRAGWAAGALLAIYPPAIFFDGLLQKATVDVLCVTVTLLLIGEFKRKPHAKWLAAAGVAVGALMLNRENARVLYPIIAGWLLVDFRDVPFTRRLAWGAVFTAALAAVLVPVGVRNYRVGGEFLISTSQLGPNFYIGNHVGASGGYDPLVPERGNAEFEREDATRLAEEASGRKLSASDVSSYWLGKSLAFIRGNPGSWLALMGRKLLLTVNTTEAMDTESIEAYADVSPVLRALGGLTFGVILPLGVLGAWVTRARWRRFAVLYAMCAGLGVSVALFYVLARYREPMVPIVMLFAGAAVAALPAIRAAWRPGLPALITTTVVAIVVNIPMRTSYDETHFNLGSQLVALGRPAEAISWLKRAAAAPPDYAAVHQVLGDALRQTGQADAAITEFVAAAKLRPADGVTYTALAQTLLEAGRAPEALPIATEAVRLRPNSAEGHGAMGLALWTVGRRPEALTHYLEAVRLGPEDPVAQNNVGTALQQQDKAREAIPYFEAAIKRKPEYAEAHSNLALAYQEAGNAGAAVDHFTIATRLQPGNFGIHANFGSLLMTLGRTAEGIAQFEQSASMLPASPDAAVTVLSLLAQAYQRSHRTVDAMATMEKARGIAKAAGRPDLTDQISRTIGAW